MLLVKTRVAEGTPTAFVAAVGGVLVAAGLADGFAVVPWLLADAAGVGVAELPPQATSKKPAARPRPVSFRIARREQTWGAIT